MGGERNDGASRGMPSADHTRCKAMRPLEMSAAARAAARRCAAHRRSSRCGNAAVPQRDCCRGATAPQRRRSETAAAVPQRRSAQRHDWEVVGTGDMRCFPGGLAQRAPARQHGTTACTAAATHRMRR